MARRAAKWPPTGIPKLPRVTSGYGGLGGLIISYDPIELIGSVGLGAWAISQDTYLLYSFMSIFTLFVQYL